MKYPEFFICEKNPCLFVYRAHVLCSLVYLFHGVHLNKTITLSNMAVMSFFLNFNRGRPIVFEFKSKTKYIRFIVKTQKQCINITIYLLY